MVTTLNGSWQQRIAEDLGDFFRTTPINSQEAADAFGRLRVSNTGQRLDVEFIYDKQEEFFDEVTNNGSVTHNGDTRDITLALADAVDGSFASMSSLPAHYTPGNSQLIDITGALDASAIGGGNAEVFLRSSITGSVTEEVIPQSGWEGLTEGVDWSKSHIFQMDFQSLKVGRIKYLMVVGGAPVKVAEITNDNKRTSGYWQLASLPVYYKLYNDATYTYMEVGYGNEANAIGFRYKILANASATMQAICCTVKSEGGKDIKDVEGLPRAVDVGVTSKSVGTTRIPLLSIRPKATWKTFDNLSITIPKSFNITTDNPIRVDVLHDCTLTNAVWTDVDTDVSAVEYDISATATGDGHVVYSEYLTTSAKNTGLSGEGILGKTVLWNRLGAESGIFTIAAVRTSNTDAEVFTSVQWEEIR